MKFSRIFGIFLCFIILSNLFFMNSGSANNSIFQVFKSDGITFIKGFDDLQSAINDSLTEDGCIIKVSASVGINEIVINKSVTITSLDLNQYELKRNLGITGNLITIESNKTVTLNNIIIDGNCSNVTDSTGSLIYINSKATFIMDTDTIIRNNQALFGGGIYNNAGTFMMNGGTITGNRSVLKSGIGEWGGGVYNSGGAFIVNNGSITGNKATYGAGIYSCGNSTQNATLVVLNGTINSNISSNNGGAIYNNYYSTATLYNAVITQNVAGNGGAVFNNGKLYICGALISDNSCFYGGSMNVDGIFNYGSMAKSLIDVIFDTNGGSYNGNIQDLYESVSVNAYAIKPAHTPVKVGYIFVGWFKSIDNGATLSAEAWDFNKDIVTEATRLYAKWKPENTAPCTTDYNVVTDYEKILSGVVVGTDDDNDPLTFDMLESPTIGNAVININGSWTYTPKPGFWGADSFKVTVSDGRGGKAVSTVNISVKSPVSVPSKIEANDIFLTEGHTATVNAVVKDQFDSVMGSVYSLKYAVENSSIAEVDAYGTVTAKTYKEGSNITTLTISVDGFSIYKTINIVILKNPVTPPPTPIPSVIEANDIVLIEGGTAKVNAIIKDQYNSVINDVYTLRYSVVDNNVVTVDMNGLVTAKVYKDDANITTLNISIDGSKVSKTIFVTVLRKAAPPAIPIPTTIEAKDIVLTEGQTTKVTTVIKDQYNRVMTYPFIMKYTVSNINVADVDINGIVTAKNYKKDANTALLKITIDGYSISKIINITVSKKEAIQQESGGTNTTIPKHEDNGKPQPPKNAEQGDAIPQKSGNNDSKYPTKNDVNVEKESPMSNGNPLSSAPKPADNGLSDIRVLSGNTFSELSDDVNTTLQETEINKLTSVDENSIVKDTNLLNSGNSSNDSIKTDKVTNDKINPSWQDVEKPINNIKRKNIVKYVIYVFIIILAFSIIFVIIKRKKKKS